jgi:hypothetical protein
MGRLTGFAAAAICVIAGAYLLQYGWSDTVGDTSGGTSWFEIIGHGMGIYFIGKGLFVARSTYLEAEQADRLAQLVAFAAYQHREPEDAAAAPDRSAAALLQQTE